MVGSGTELHSDPYATSKEIDSITPHQPPEQSATQNLAPDFSFSKPRAFLGFVKPDKYRQMHR